VKSGKRYWADGTRVAGQQFEYGFDDLGNRSSAKTGGDALGANLRSQGYTVNDLSLYTTRTNPRYLKVQGAAQTTATVQVDGSTNGVLRQGEYFRRELGSIAGTGPVWQTVAVALSGGTNTVTQRLFLPPGHRKLHARRRRQPHAGRPAGLRLGRRESPRGPKFRAHRQPGRTLKGARPARSTKSEVERNASNGIIGSVERAPGFHSEWLGVWCESNPVYRCHEQDHGFLGGSAS
jgi:hypothetical protein